MFCGSLPAEPSHQAEATFSIQQAPGSDNVGWFRVQAERTLGADLQALRGRKIPGPGGPSRASAAHHQVPIGARQAGTLWKRFGPRSTRKCAMRGNGACGVKREAVPSGPVLSKKDKAAEGKQQQCGRLRNNCAGRICPLQISVDRIGADRSWRQEHFRRFRIRG